MHRGGSGHAGTGFRNRPHHNRGIEDAETRAAIRFGNADAKPAGIGKSFMEVGGITAFLVLLQPIGIIKTRAEFCHGITGTSAFASSSLHSAVLRVSKRRASSA